MNSKRAHLLFSRAAGGIVARGEDRVATSSPLFHGDREACAWCEPSFRGRSRKNRALTMTISGTAERVLGMKTGSSGAGVESVQE